MMPLKMTPRQQITHAVNSIAWVLEIYDDEITASAASKIGHYLNKIEPALDQIPDFPKYGDDGK